MKQTLWYFCLFLIFFIFFIKIYYEYLEDGLVNVQKRFQDEHFEVHNLMKKMKKQNCKFHVHPDVQKNGLRGLYANKNFEKGSVIMSVPTEAVYWCTVSNEDLTLCATKLALEIYKEKKSKFFDQIQSAPSLEEFKSYMIYFQPKLVHKFKFLFSKEIVNFIQNFHIKLSDENEQWAYMILKSRAFNAYGWFAWVGIIDLLNHSPTPNAEMDAIKPNMFRIIATKKIKKNEEIFIEYHKGKNSAFLDTYGFINLENENMKKLSRSKCKYLKSICLEEQDNPNAQVFIQLAMESCNWHIPTLESKNEL